MLAHILVCFLAYVLWKTLAQWMRRSGLGDAPRTLLEELAKIKSGDVVLPTATQAGPLQRHRPAALRHRAGRGPKGAAPPPRHHPPPTPPAHRRGSYKCSGNIWPKNERKSFAINESTLATRNLG